VIRNILIILFCFFSLNSFSQRKSTKRSTGYITPKSFIGTWLLTKLADKHLNYISDSVQTEFLIFTKDSVFVRTGGKEYAGTWKLKGEQPIIRIKQTSQFNYQWISGNIDSKFFTTPNLGYYKYFIRIKN